MKTKCLILKIMIFTCANFFLTGSAFAGYYRWVDDNGEVHYSQQAPKQRPAQSIHIPKSALKSQPVVKKDKDMSQEPLSKDPLDPADMSQNEIKRKNCKIARDNLAIYQNNSVIMRGGKPYTIADNEKNNLTDEANRQIQQFCK
jgi:hypothetical protein